MAFINFHLFPQKYFRDPEVLVMSDWEGTVIVVPIRLFSQDLCYSMTPVVDCIPGLKHMLMSRDILWVMGEPDVFVDHSWSLGWTLLTSHLDIRKFYEELSLQPTDGRFTAVHLVFSDPGVHGQWTSWTALLDSDACLYFPEKNHLWQKNWTLVCTCKVAHWE